MKNFKIIVSAFLTISLASCAFVEVPTQITPNQMAKYKTVENLITAKNLNGKDGRGKAFLLTGYKEAFLPYAYMNNLCKSDNGVFKQIQKASFLNLESNTRSYKVRGKELEPYIGTFKCSSNTTWYVNIEPISSSMTGVNNDLDLIKLKTVQISAFTAQANVVSVDNQRQQMIESRNKILKEQKETERKILLEKQKFLSTNKPTRQDIGQTICNNSVLSVFTGMYVFGEPHFRQENGTAIATVEGFSSDQRNIKINIRGYLNGNNSISSGQNVLYKQIPLEAGKVIWEKNENWFKCNYS